MIKLAYLILVSLMVLSVSCSMGLTGDNGLEVSGNATSNVVTLRLDGSVIRGVLADSGNATGDGNWITLSGGGNVTTSASGYVVTISATTSGGNASYAEDSDKLDGQHGSYYLPASGGNSTYAGDSDKLDGQHGSYYLPASGGNSTYAGDSDKLDGQHGSDYLLASKVLHAHRAMNDATGDVAYTGVGFSPTSLQVNYGMATSFFLFGTGIADRQKNMYTQFNCFVGYYGETTYLIDVEYSSGHYQMATLKSYDSDGFTLTWTKTGTNAGTVELGFICYR